MGRNHRQQRAALQEPIRQVFEVSGFAAIFPIYATAANAVAALQ